MIFLHDVNFYCTLSLGTVLAYTCLKEYIQEEGVMRIMFSSFLNKGGQMRKCHISVAAFLMIFSWAAIQTEGNADKDKFEHWFKEEVSLLLDKAEKEQFKKLSTTEEKEKFIAISVALNLHLSEMKNEKKSFQHNLQSWPQQ